MQEVSSHSLTYTSSPLENKKGVQHEEENFVLEISGTREGL